MKTRTIWLPLAVLPLGLLTLANAQESVNGGMTVLGPLRSSGTQGLVDFTLATGTSPVKSGTLATRPSTCTSGQMYFATDAATGQNLSLCASAAWTTIVGGGGGAGVNKQTTTSYTLQDTDSGKLVTFSNGPAAVSLPQAGAAAHFTAGWVVDVQNLAPGTATITPVTSTIDGAASVLLTSNQGVRIFSDGANYFTERGVGGAGGGATQASIFGSIFAGGVEYQNAEKCLSTITIPYTQVQTAATIKPITVASVSGIFSPRTMYVFESAQFTSGTITALTVGLGISGSPNLYSGLAVPLMQASPTRPEGGVSVDVLNPTILATFTSTSGQNLTALTAGGLDVKICGVLLQ